MDGLLSWDKNIFTKINQGFPFDDLDRIALFISSSKTWWALAVLVLFLGIILRRKKWLKVLLCCSLSLGVSDLVNSYGLKPLFKRQRPCHQMEVRLRQQHCGSLYGMPSNHASNGAAVFTASAFWLSKGLLGIIGVLVLLVGWSRIYLGVHFPLDVLCGFGVGAMLATITTLLVIKTVNYRRNRL